MSKFFIPSLLILFLFNILFPIASAAPSCISSCNNGQCMSTNQCACNPNYFTNSAPCDTRATSLKNTQYISQAIPANNWAYYYISLYKISSQVQLTFEVDQGTALVYTILQDSDSYELPSASTPGGFRISPVTTGDNTFTYSISRSNVQNTNGGWLTLALFNDGTVETDLQLKYTATFDTSADDSSDDSDDNGISSDDLLRAIIVLPAIFVGIVFFVCVYVAAKNRRRRMLQQQRVHMQVQGNHPRENYEVVVVMNEGQIQMVAQNSEDYQRLQAQLHQQLHAQNRQHGVPHAQPQIHPAPHQHREQRAQGKFLTREEIHKYFPRNHYKAIKSPFPQPTCSICLDEFQPESLCHKLYCYHIFHEKCIEAWLAKHDSCPDCRKPITREAIKQFFREKKLKKHGNSPNGTTSPSAQSLQSFHH